MKYDRFEDLPVWNKAIDLAESVYLLTQHRFYSQRGDLCDQMHRASLSVSNNIAEGFERGSTAELLAFLYYARGSAGENRSMLHFCLRLLERFAPRLFSASEISDLKSQVSELIPMAESCSRQIRAWADSLQNSDIKGQRHLNEQVKGAYDAERRRMDFQQRVRDQFRQRHPELSRNSGNEP